MHGCVYLIIDKVTGLCVAFNCNPRHQPWTQVEDKRLMELWSSGALIDQIAHELQRNMPSVRSRIGRLR